MIRLWLLWKWEIFKWSGSTNTIKGLPNRGAPPTLSGSRFDINIETDPKDGRPAAIVDSDGFYVERTRRADRQVNVRSEVNG